jgi:hypothetical protein
LVLGRTQFTLAELSPFSHTQCLNAQNRNLDTSDLMHTGGLTIKARSHAKSNLLIIGGLMGAGTALGGVVEEAKELSSAQPLVQAQAPPT